MILLKGVANHTLGLISVLHLFLYRLQAKNDVYIFKWLEEKRKFYEIVSIHRILLEHNHAYSHPVTFVLQWQSRVAGQRPAKSQIFTIWSFIKKVC